MRMFKLIAALPAVLLLGPLLGPDAALAHHPIGGMTPQTMWHGLLSGIGHPIIEPDHLAFILLAGAISALAVGGFRIAAAFVLASLCGVAVHLALAGLPLIEPAVAASVLLAGILLASGGQLAAPTWMALVAVAGLLHGYAYGEAVLGAQTTVVGAYLIGLGVVQLTMAMLAMLVMRTLTVAPALRPARVRTAGYTFSVAGALLLMAALVQA